MSEYINRAAQFAQSAAQLSKNLSENLVENAKDFRIDNTLQLFENGEDKLDQVKTLLDSKYDKEKLTGLKILIAVSF
jgi:AP-3 complex subunit beta